MSTHIISERAWERVVSAVEKVRERMRRAAQAWPPPAFLTRWRGGQRRRGLGKRGR
jgi:hypothetical protein